MAHRNARLTPHGRLLLCGRVEDDGWKLLRGGCSRRRQPPDGGQVAGALAGRGRRRPPRPLLAAAAHRPAPGRRAAAQGRAAAPAKRRGPAWIAWRTDLAPATVYRALRRRGLHRLRLLEPREAAVRYCWPRAGDLVHLDTKRLARIGAGGGRRLAGYRAQTTTGHRLGLRPRGRRRRHPAGLRRGARRRARRDRGGLPGACPGLLLRPRRLGAAAAHRQRQPATARTPSRGGTRRTVCATCARGPTGRRPTARRRPS